MNTTNTVTTLFLSAVLAFLPSAAFAQDEAEPAGKSGQLTLDDLRTFTDVFNQARRSYVEPVDDKTLLDSAIRGMLSELDPHSAYLAPEQFAELEDASRGRYSGVGVSLETGDQKIVVDAVINGSPADEAGINPGDIITAVDGRPVKGRFLPDAIDDMEGDPGSDITLTVVTPGGEERELSMTREYILIPSLGFEMLEESYGYFRITQFHRDSATHLEQALESIAAEGTELRGLVIDLRDNPGGVLQPAVAIADGFLEEGVIVTTRGKNASMQLEFSAHEGDWLPGAPVVILVDRGSASASEVLAGALQDHGRALIVGERTFGKGSVQSVLPLRNGGAIKLTTARYYTPSGRSIQAKGIVPDIEIDAYRDGYAEDETQRESDLAGHLENGGTEIPPPRPKSASPVEFPVEQILSILEQADLLGGDQVVPDENDTEETGNVDAIPGSG